MADYTNLFPTPETPMEPKSVLKSKTVWVNALILAAGVATYLSGHELIVENPAVVSILTVIVGGINVALRFFTKQPVK